MRRKYTEGVMQGQEYDYGNLSKNKVWEMESAFASSALEGLDNPKINQYLIVQEKEGLTTKESIIQMKQQLQSNSKEFLAQFD